MSDLDPASCGHAFATRGPGAGDGLWCPLCRATWTPGADEWIPAPGPPIPEYRKVGHLIGSAHRSRTSVEPINAGVILWECSLDGTAVTDRTLHSRAVHGVETEGEG